MKKLLISLMCGAMLMSTAACSTTLQNTSNSTASTVTETTGTPVETSETLESQPTDTAGTTETAAEETTTAPADQPAENQTPAVRGKTAKVAEKTGDAAKTGGVVRKPAISPDTTKKQAELLEQTKKAVRQPGKPGAAVLKGSTREGNGFLLDISESVKFTAETTGGEPADSSIFKNYKLTMINIWGTLCKPCIAEMPDIQKLYEEMKEQQVNVIGFIANSEADRKEKAATILKEKGVTYTNILFDDATSQGLSAQISGYPTTIFVDSEGNIVGQQIAGTKSLEEYKKEIESRLESLGQ